MRKPICLSFLICFFTMFYSIASLAQPTPADSSSQQNAFNNAVSLFYSTIGNQSPLFNGPEYYYYDPLIKGNAYFLDVNAFTPGTIYYDGASYSGAPMLYDTYSDKVVVLLYNHFSKFSLVNSKVKSFDYLEHHFVNINQDTLAITSELKSGYYDQLYGGKTEVLVKRYKDIQTTNGSATNGSESYFNTKKEYYVRKNHAYYSVGGEGSMLDILKDHKKELQQYIKANKIKFRREPEEAMVKIASYYDQLTK